MEEELRIVERRVGELGRALELPAEKPALEEIRRVVTVFRELRDGKTEDGKSKLKSPSGSLSTAEAISVVTNGLAMAAYYGDGVVRAGDMAAGERGVLHERMLSDGHLAAVRRLRELTGVSMGNLLPGAGGPEVTETQRRHVRAVAEALPGFTPLIEPLSGNPELPVRDPWTATELCRETGAGLLLDVFHLAELGVDVDGWLDDVAARKQPLPHHVQIADSPGRGAPGTGDAPIGKWLRRLADLGYAGRVADEWLG